MWTYGLSGAANQDTIPTSGPSAFDGTQHPRTIITLSALGDASGALPQSLADPTYFDVSLVDLGGGRSARVSQPKSGFGPYRVEWIQAGSLYTLLCARGKTISGTSGVPLSDLERMAESVG